MAIFSTTFSFVLSNEDYTPPRYDVTHDPVAGVDLTAQAISGINSHWYPTLFSSIVVLPQVERGPAVEAAYQSILWNEWVAAVTSDDVAAHVADAEFNEGARTGVKMLQEAVNVFGDTDLVVDGIWGPATVSAANAQPPTALLQTFTVLRVAAYKAIKGISPATLAEWIARAEKPLP